MSVFKCKMCGGDLEITEGMSVCECQYCGSKQTLPKLSDEKKKNLYDRASHFRRNNEYDKAMAIYEQILNEDAEDAESYWSIVLCQYGIEYVEDPATHRRVPTVNRAQLTSIFSDENYKSALKYADSEQRAVYEAEAKEIEQIQKGILAISSKEEPFDVFICYKESDAAGRRTPDSVLANDLYHQLTQEGFKVFFARITLEDKLGSAYEPYIFAALNSAKVMVVLGTKPEYFTAVWVKNEWSRFLAQIKGGANKALIPAYKDMDPYDLPEEFSHLQAQDMSKLGFMQDLIRGIKKLTGAEEKKKTSKTIAESVPVTNGAQALVERAFLFLEDGDFARADELCEQALNQDPKNSQAYVGKLMVERKLRKQEALSEGTEELTENNYFQKALRFAEDGLKKELERCNQMIMDRNEHNRQMEIEHKKDLTYDEAMRMVKQNSVEGSLQAAIKVLDSAIGKYESLLGWKDSEAQIEACKSQKSALIDQLYQNTQELVDKHSSKKIDSKTMVNVMGTAIANLEYLGEYLDSKKLLADCVAKKDLHEKKIKKARNKKIGRLVMAGIVVVVLVVAGNSVLKAMQLHEYNQAMECLEAGDYKTAKDSFENLGEYKDSKEYVAECIYKQAIEYMEDAKYEKALKLLKKLDGNYKDTRRYIAECDAIIEQSMQYATAMSYKAEGKYSEAKELFESISEYSDSKEQAAECYELFLLERQYTNAMSFKTKGEYIEAKKRFAAISEYSDSKEQITECYKLQYKAAMSYKIEGKYSEAKELFDTISEYSDSKKQATECYEFCLLEQQYADAMSLKTQGKYIKAKRMFESISEYSDSKEQATKCIELQYNLAMSNKTEGKYIIAKELFESISEYSDSKEQATKCAELQYSLAMSYKTEGKYIIAKELFESVSEYSDSKEQATKCAELQYSLAMSYKTEGKYIEARNLFASIAEYSDSKKQVSQCIDRLQSIISAGDSGTVGLKSDGTVMGWWSEENDNVAVSVGSGGILFLKSDGKVKVSNYIGNSFWWDIVAISAGGTQHVGVKSDGTVFVTGQNSYGQCNVEDWTDIVAVSAGEGYTVGLKSDGTVIAVGNNRYGQCNVEDWTDIVAVSAGKDHTVGLKSDGTVIAVGDNSSGQCNVEDWSNIGIPSL